MPAATLAPTVRRRLPIGAEVLGNGAHFRVWAPNAARVDVVVDDVAHALTAEPDHYFSGGVAGLTHGARYRFRLDDDPALVPDPASRFQPEGPHGPSQIVDPARFAWTDGAWRGRALAQQVLYEMHVGTFTRDGTWAAATRELDALRHLGVTVLEVMPVADFAGRFGWGYDGVDLFAPTRLYGAPDDFRRFVDRAHALGLAVILDVVYNHLGPDGNYLKRFADDYFTDRYENEWGEPINFDGSNAGPVREFVVANAGYWIDEYHLDGLRLDATQQIFDASDEHIVAAIVRRVRQAARGRATIVVAENEAQDSRVARPAERAGFGADGMWNDDFHHTARVAATGRRDAYYLDYLGTPQELISAIKYGFLYQGQRYAWQSKRRGRPAYDLPPSAFVTYLQNHDQVANSARGARLHALTSPGRYRALTTLLLLGPGTPLLFQGQEFAASAPFLFFANHVHPLRAAVRKGRAEFLAQFPGLATPELQACLADPGDPATFERCKLDHDERARHADEAALVADLLRLRRDDGVFGTPRGDPARRCTIDGAVLAPDAFVVRFFGEPAGNDRLLLVNLGRDARLGEVPEPLLAPPEGCAWRLLWSSEAARYGGCGIAPVEHDRGWLVPGEAAVALGLAHPMGPAP
jgi:maltooligosyltrehalose trehalohydrolase